MTIIDYYLKNNGTRLCQKNSKDHPDCPTCSGDFVEINGKYYEIVKSDYDYEVWQVTKDAWYTAYVVEATESDYKQYLQLKEQLAKSKPAKGTVEHYSKNIQNVIQKELFRAKHSIKIVVAWFTNDLLFQPLLMKVQCGIHVEIILNKDDINFSGDNDINFNEFVEKGGVLRWNTSKQLMHDKFCIIDDEIVITGSYNWTNKAEYNHENICVFRDEKQTVDFYNSIFNELSQLYSPEVREEIVKDIPNLPKYKTLQDVEPRVMQPTTIMPLKTRLSRAIRAVSSNLFEVAPPIDGFPELRFYDSVECCVGTYNEIINANGILLYAKNRDTGKLALLRDDFSPLTDFRYSKFDIRRECVLLYSDNGCTLYNPLTHEMLTPCLGYERELSNNMFVMSRAQKFGIVNSKGEQLVEFDFLQYWTPFNYGSKYVLLSNGIKWGIFFTENLMLYPCEFSDEEINLLIKSL